MSIELQEMNERKKEVFAETKGDRLVVKILKELVKLRKQDQGSGTHAAVCSIFTCGPWKRPILPGWQRPRDSTGRVGKHHPPFPLIDRWSRRAGARNEIDARAGEPPPIITRRLVLEHDETIINNARSRPETQRL